MAARLLADEHFPLGVVYWLGRLGHDVATVRDEGLAGTSDESLFEWCRERERAVLTYNYVDFRELHYAQPGHGGVVACKHKPERETDRKFARRIDDKIRQHLREKQSLCGSLLRVTIEAD